MHALILAAAVVIHPNLALAGNCDDPQTNLEMTNCAWAAYKTADKELNDVWQKVIASIKDTSEDIMPAEERTRWLNGMIDAQKAWATFKDTDCNVGIAHEWWGGSGASLSTAACLKDHTQQRIDELKDRYGLGD